MTRSATDTMPTDRELLETAAAWRLRVFGDSEPTAEDAAAFEHWLSASPRHQTAFDRASAAWDLLEPHTAAPEVIRARRDALDYARKAGERRWLREPGRRTALRIAACAVAAVALGASVWPLVDGVDVYRTHRGERREVTLADGSSVLLDANTKLRVRYTDEARRLTLDKGQARFQVAHNAYRPFTVTAGDRTVVATGTAFNVDLLGRAVRVTLIEGSVVVRPVAAAPVRLTARPAPAPVVALKSGQQLTAVEGVSAASVQSVKVADATAWERGKLVLDNVPLAEAAARVNRYTERKVVVDDPAVADLRVSGVFQTGDADTFARAMAQFLKLDADFEGDRIHLTLPANG